MRVCDFHLQASSALLPGSLLEGLLAPMLEKSTRRAVVRQGRHVPRAAPGERSIGKIKLEKPQLA